MANSIELAQRYLPLLDEIYKRSSLTADLDQQTVEMLGGNAVKVFKTSMQGLGNYNRNNGFVDGDVTGAWETLTLTQDRGRSFMVDRMDNEESLDQAFGTLASEFIRTRVVPEVDAYRFAKYAGTSGVLTTTGVALTTSTIVDAIDVATAAMDEKEVPTEGRILYITPTNYTMLKQSNAVSRFAMMTDRVVNRDFEVFDGMKVVKVPQGRFYTEITLYDGKTSGQEDGGYIKTAETGKDINFMIIHPSAVLQVPKHTLPRIFNPDENQKADAWKFDYRFYHDAFVYENKKNGIYLHKGA